MWDDLKRVKLTKGREALVDDADYELVSQHKWFAQRQDQTWYARASINGVKVRMHRFIMGVLKGDKREVDHKDHNGLNNCRKNLRVVTAQQNNFNRRAKGFRKVGKKYRAFLRISGDQIHLGTYDDPRMARAAYLCGKQLFHPMEDT